MEEEKFNCVFVYVQHVLYEQLVRAGRNTEKLVTCIHPCTTHAPAHTRPSLPVNPNPNPTPAEEYALELHYIAAIDIFTQDRLQPVSRPVEQPLLDCVLLLKLVA